MYYLAEYRELLQRQRSADQEIAERAWETGQERFQKSVMGGCT
jgi:hypothetical protein